MITEKIYDEHSREISWVLKRGLACFRRFWPNKAQRNGAEHGPQGWSRKTIWLRTSRLHLTSEVWKVAPRSSYKVVYNGVNIDGLTLITKITFFENLRNYIYLILVLYSVWRSNLIEFQQRDPGFRTQDMLHLHLAVRKIRSDQSNWHRTDTGQRHHSYPELNHTYLETR